MAILQKGIVPASVAAAMLVLLPVGSSHAASGAAEPTRVSSGVGEWRVGPDFDPDCDFQDIQDAIDATVANDGGFSTINIRVAGGTSVHAGNIYTVDGTEFENITTVRIIGGHTDCSGSPFPGGRTILDAEQSGRVFLLSYEADNGDPLFTMELDNLEIRNGLAPFAGGGIRIRSHADLHRVRLQNVDIHSNETASSGSGGGISIEATSPGTSPTSWVTISQDSRIVGNHADGGGGGVACFNTTGSDNPPVLLFEVPVVGNSAVANGGGMAVHGCQNFSIRSAGFDQRLGGNEAGASGGSGDGGGLHVSGGARVTLEASGNSESAEMFGNSAENGAAVAVVDASSALTLVNARIYSNFAGNEGGGLFVDDQAEVVMGRVGGVTGSPGDCQPSPGLELRCSELYSNHAATASAMAVRGGANAAINQTRIRANVAEDAGASSVLVSGEDSSALFEGLVMYGQLDSEKLFRVEAGTLRIRWSTIAGNDNDGALNAVIQLNKGVGGQSPQLNVDSSIIWEPSLILIASAGSGYTAAADCVIAHLDEGNSGFDSLNFYSQVDPSLRGRYNGDLRLAPDSPAIDYCDDGIAPEFNDFFDRPRGIEYNLDPDTPPVDAVPGGTFDLGAFEQPHFEDVIHADRFEN
jgi:hypothetical protein